MEIGLKGSTKIELGSFYLGAYDTVFVFTKRTEKKVVGTAWQGGLMHRVVVESNKKGEVPYTFLPIDPAIAKLIQSGQNIPMHPLTHS